MHANQLCTETDYSVCYESQRYRPFSLAILSSTSLSSQRWRFSDFVMQINNHLVEQTVNLKSQKLYKQKNPPHNKYTRWFKVQKANGLKL